MSSAYAVIPGCEAWSARAGHRHGDGASPVGALVLHGFTGTPASVRNVAEAVAAAGFDVELPRLPGHGTTVDDVLATGWEDWTDEVARAHRTLRECVDEVVVIGQSMGGTLALWAALELPRVAGLVCINPMTTPRDPDTMALIEELIDDGIAVAPGEGSDIADPDASDIAYDGTPLAPVRSLLVDGVAPLTGRFGELTVPLRLLTSRHDHVVPPSDSEHLASSYGGPVEHIWLERSFHVATRDFDRDVVVAESVAFVERVAA